MQTTQKKDIRKPKKTVYAVCFAGIFRKPMLYSSFTRR